jgi:hypothetical protein
VARGRAVGFGLFFLLFEISEKVERFYLHRFLLSCHNRYIFEEIKSSNAWWLAAST